MTTDRWRLIERIYHDAVERAPGDRPAFLVTACSGDAELRREVQSLLDQPSMPDFLEAPAIQIAAAMDDGSTAPWSGRRIGAYQVQALIGKGGMGEVYRAHDTRLGRDVAIKVLPKAFTADPDRLARFEREARLLASLNHPHIGTIHGLEESDGGLALVLELVEGDTLAERIARGPVPIALALTMARQIADALEAAHDKGIVHRDLKPANIKITPDDVVKVLDFGLAKSGPIGGSELTQSPTITAVGTETGVVLGTAAYMSPEQARGQVVDKRADVWAFGCVLYELLTSHAAFAQATVSDTVAAILTREPDWAALPPDLPWSVTTLLHRCLERDVRKRKRELSDARVELDEALAHREPAEVRSASAGVRPARPSLVPWAVAAAAAALAVAAVTALVWPRWQNPLADAQFVQVTSFPGAEENAAISPDGRWVAFLSDRTGKFHVWLTQIGPGDFTDLTPQDEDQRLNRAASPDLGFTGDGLQIWLGGSPARTRRMQLVSLTGGGARRPYLTEKAGSVGWSPDGRRIVYNTNEPGDPLFLADPVGAGAVQILVSDAGWHNHGAIWSTDGEWIYYAHGHPDVEMNLWRVRPQPGSTPEALTEHVTVSSMAPIDASTVLYTGRAEDGSGPWLWALDVTHRTSHRVSSGLEQYTSISASSDGRSLAASLARPRATLWAVPLLDRMVEPRDVRPFGPQGVRTLSPRLRGRALFYLSAMGTGDGLWRYADGQSTEIWQGSQGGLLEPPAISRDGLHAAVVLRKNGRRTLTTMDVDGGNVRSLAESIDVRGTADWSPDGQWIVIAGEQLKSGAAHAGLFKIPSTGTGEPVELVAGGASDPVWEKDLILYGGPDVGGLSPLKAVRANGDPVDLPPTVMNSVVGPHRFLPDGSGVVFVRGPLRGPEFWLLDLKTMASRQLTRIGDPSLGDLRAFDVSANGQQIIFDRIEENSDIVLIKRPAR